MTTTLTNIQAGAAYDTLQDQIRQELNTIKDLMNRHERQAQQEGVHWGHVGDLMEVKALLQRITMPEA